MGKKKKRRGKKSAIPFDPPPTLLERGKKRKKKEGGRKKRRRACLIQKALAIAWYCGFPLFEEKGKKENGKGRKGGRLNCLCRVSAVLPLTFLPPKRGGRGGGGGKEKGRGRWANGMNQPELVTFSLQFYPIEEEKGKKKKRGERKGGGKGG